MPTYYRSKFYSQPIEVFNDNGDVMVITVDSFERESIYSWYNLKEKYSESIYINKCLLGGYMQETIKKVLVIGAGGGAFIKHVEDHINGVEVTGIDIDETMYEIAKNELSIETRDFIIGDAVIAVKQLVDEGRSYDLILFDVYGGAGEIPEHLMGGGMFHNIKSLLSTIGIFSINYSNFIIGSDDINDITRVEHYNKIHENIKKIFGDEKQFIAFLSGEGDGGNVSGIYNLDKKYTKDEILNNYSEKVASNEIIFDSKICESIYLDDIGDFLE